MPRPIVYVFGVFLLPNAWAAMVDSSVDQVAGPFCYLAKPSALLGGVGSGVATQVTWDGAFYNGAAELCIVTGNPPEPVAVRIKRLGGGYMPLVHYSWLRDDVRLSVSAFAAALAQGAPPANFIRLRVTRLGDSGAPASIGFGLRYCGLDHRALALQQTPFDPSATYAFDRGTAVVAGRVVCIMPDREPDRQYSVADRPYAGPFSGQDFAVGPTTAVLLALWDLGQQEDMTIDLKMPWTPLPADAQAQIEALRKADFAEYADGISRAWEAELGRGLQIVLPEEKPLETYRANLATLLMSTEIPREGRPRFRNPLSGASFALGDSALLVQSLDRSGRPDLARSAIEGWLDQQHADGCLSPNEDLDAHCQALRTLIDHVWLVGDRPWAEQVYPKAWRAAEWALSKLQTEARGLDVGVGLNTVEALGHVAELATLVGKAQEGAELRQHRDRLLRELEERLIAQVVPSSAAVAIVALNRGLPDSLEVPTVAPHSEYVTDLCRRMRATSAEGLATQDGSLSPMLTMDLARLHALRGEQEQAVRDLYSVLVHTGSCHEGFVGGVTPWADRDCRDYPSPDPRFSAAYVLFLRDLLIREELGKLHLFTGFSPAWLKEGQKIGVVNAPTSFGLVTAIMQIEQGGAVVIMAADWHAAPSRVVFHVPYCVDPTYVDADRPGLRQFSGPRPATYDTAELRTAASEDANTYIELRPDTTRVTLRWALRDEAELSYETAVEEWRESYAAHYRDYLAAGHAPLILAPIALR